MFFGGVTVDSVAHTTAILSHLNIIAHFTSMCNFLSP